MTAPQNNPRPDHACRVCGAFGAFGRRRNLGNWREGYFWWCAQHRHLMPAVPAHAARQPSQPPTLDKGGQRRLL